MKALDYLDLLAKRARKTRWSEEPRQSTKANPSPAVEQEEGLGPEDESALEQYRESILSTPAEE